MSPTTEEFIDTIFDLKRDDELVCVTKPISFEDKDTGKEVNTFTNKRVRSSDFQKFLKGNEPADWYVCISTVCHPENGEKLKRGGKQIKLTYCIVLDDVGTKVKEEDIPLPPSWKMETSPENFQWGYLIIPDDRQAKVEALINALIKMDMSDPGAIGVYRVVRIPGSVNMKPKNDGWLSRVTNWHPERCWTLDELAAEFGIDLDALVKTVGEESEQQASSINQPDIDVFGDGPPAEYADLLLNFLTDKGYVVEDNGGEWVKVTCPWHKKHTTGENTAGYSPMGRGEGDWRGTRAFKCLHAHCQDRHYQQFSDWAVGRGGPLLPGVWDASSAAVERLNLSYFVVRAGGKTLVGEWVVTNDRRTLNLFRVSDLHAWFANDQICVGDDKCTTASKVWITAPSRRQFEGIEFAPDGDLPEGYLNLWQGFSVESDPSGSCQRFLDHIRDNICNGDDELYSWCISWFAQIVQQPRIKPGTALVLRGGQGTGKTIVGEIFGRLIREHHVTVSRAKHITGAFNQHLAQCLFLQAEEAFWAGSKDAEGTLKDLVTGHTQLIEPKGVDAIPVRNVLRLFVTTNNEWAVPAGMQERRFAVYDVSDARQQDLTYFKALIDQMNDGGYEALLHYLLNFDLSTVNLRQPPKTDALLDQVLASLPPEQSWWLEVLQRGWISRGDNAWCGKFTYNRVHQSYVDHAHELGISRPLTKERLGRALRNFTEVAECRKSGIKPREYFFQELDDCRVVFDNFLGMGVKWRDPEKEL